MVLSKAVPRFFKKMHVSPSGGNLNDFWSSKSISKIVLEDKLLAQNQSMLP